MDYGRGSKLSKSKIQNDSASSITAGQGASFKAPTLHGGFGEGREQHHDPSSKSALGDDIH